MKLKLIIFIALMMAMAMTQECSTTCGEGNCNEQGICARCNENSVTGGGSADNTPSSDCRCPVGERHTTAGGCQPCSALCEECETNTDDNDAEICTKCKAGPGLALNLETNACGCLPDYQEQASQSDNPNGYCKECYIYGNKCLPACPAETKQNEEVKICEIGKAESVENDDKTHIIIVAVIIIVVQLLLSIALYNYLFSKLKEAFTKDQNAVYELSPEERAYLANQGDVERNLALRDDGDRRSRTQKDSASQQSEVIE